MFTIMYANEISDIGFSAKQLSVSLHCQFSFHVSPQNLAHIDLRSESRRFHQRVTVSLFYRKCRTCCGLCSTECTIGSVALKCECTPMRWGVVGTGICNLLFSKISNRILLHVKPRATACLYSLYIHDRMLAQPTLAQA